MHEPLSNIGFVSPRKNRPDPELARHPPSWFVGQEVDRADSRYCYGELDNDPIATDRIKCGDPVRFTPSQVAEVV